MIARAQFSQDYGMLYSAYYYCPLTMPTNYDDPFYSSLLINEFPVLCEYVFDEADGEVVSEADLKFSLFAP